MTANNEPLFVDSALLQPAEQLCRTRLLKDPGNRAALRSLGHVLRKLGHLEEASDVYARLTALDPEDRESRYMHAIFSGSEWPTAPGGAMAAPFVLVKNVLPADLHETLLPLVVSVQDSLVPATVGTGEYKPDTRESLDLPNPLRWEATQRFRKMLRNNLPKFQARLNVPAFELGLLEFKLRVYKDGHFFRVHMDAPRQVEESSHRKLSYVYFFHKVPRAYTGGDLVLFDSDIVNNTYTTDAFTRIIPEDNALVVFPSHYYHCVVPLKTHSDDFLDSRFVINGHVSERVASAAEKPSEQVVVES